VPLSASFPRTHRRRTTDHIPMTLAHIIDSYGYAALVIGTFLEGETVLVLGGIAAKLGYLKLPWVIVSAFIGTLAGDQLFFFLGRRHGQALLLKRPQWHRRAQKVRHMLERHRVPVCIGFRFLYGFRTISPFVIGMSRIPAWQFVLLNIIGAAAWATLIGTLGFTFGQGLELLLGDIHHYEKEILGAVSGVGVAVWLFRWALNRKRCRGGVRH
jgi:membrane protein DedA with SNARE-associated domain